MFKNKKKEQPPEKTEIRRVPSERDTINRIEAVTDRLEWLAKEIEYQLEQSRNS